MESINFLLLIIILILIITTRSSILYQVRNLEDMIYKLQNKIQELQKHPQSPPTISSQVEEKKEIISKPEIPVIEPEEKKDWPKYMPSTAKKEPEKMITKEKVSEPEKEIKIIPPIVTQRSPEPKKKNDFEKLLGENLLSKIGIATLVLGVAYFVKYAIDQNWINEIGRVAIGILAGGAIIGIAHKLKDNYRTFSSILIGGGISVLYITITIAFREYALFSQTVSFIFLILITIFSVILSILYDRKELAIFSLLGGFASPLMISSGTGNYIVLFSYIFILNAGMLAISFKKQWKIVSIIAYVLTQFFYWSWLFLSFDKETHGYVGAILFIGLFYIQFYLLSMIEYFRHERKLTAFQALIILSNNLSLFAAAIYIFKYYPLDLKGLITICMAAFNAVPMFLLFKNKAFDKNMLYMLVAIVLTFVSLAVPIQLEGCAITMFWAAETVILLWLWQKSKINIFKSGFIIIQCLVLISLIMDWGNYYTRSILYPENILPVMFNKVCITGLFISFTILFNSWLTGKEKSEIFIRNYNTKVLRKFYTGLWIILLFLTGIFELNYQISYHFPSEMFCKSVNSLYFLLFLMIVLLVRWNKVSGLKLLYCLSLFSIAFYVTAYLYFTFNIRGEILFEELPGWWYFNIHYLSFPALVVIYTFILKKKEILSDKTYQNLIYWLFAITSVIILSVETDNILLMNFINRYGETIVLKNSHSIAYPILWGIISFLFMFWGMKKKIQTLRIISLTLFSLIILKLYLYDVWHMQPTGRILAFIFLGILFLVVSFMYQKVKKLLTEKENEKVTE